MPERRWKPLESNPEAIATYAGNLGFNTAKYGFYDVVATEDWAIEMLPSTPLAFIFLYPITAPQDEHHKSYAPRADTPADRGSLVAVKQNIGNACGTIALLHATANLATTSTPDIVVAKPDASSSWLQDFIASAAGKTPEDAAKFVEESDELETAHAASADSEENSTETSPEDAVNEHFVAFIQNEQGVWEMDGRRLGGVGIYQGPVTEGSTFSSIAMKCVQATVERDPASYKFSIIAICANE
jgi:ubiquitin carboxyl-terminal hydrolase L3